MPAESLAAPSCRCCLLKELRRRADVCSCVLGPQELKARHREVMQELLMDVLRALGSPNMDIRKKTLDIALDLITARNIDEARPLSLGLLQWQSSGTRACNIRRSPTFVLD